jgi:hypothetical protein
MNRQLFYQRNSFSILYADAPRFWNDISLKQPIRVAENHFLTLHAQKRTQFYKDKSNIKFYTMVSLKES